MLWGGAGLRFYRASNFVAQFFNFKMRAFVIFIILAFLTGIKVTRTYAILGFRLVEGPRTSGAFFYRYLPKKHHKSSLNSSYIVIRDATGYYLIVAHV